MSDVFESLEVELARATRAVAEAEQKRQAAHSEHQRADTAAQRANRWRDAVDDALDILRTEAKRGAN